jgi:hypothetical protein
MKKEKVMSFKVFLLLLCVSAIIISFSFCISKPIGYFITIIVGLFTLAHDVPRLFINKDDYENLKK